VKILLIIILFLSYFKLSSFEGLDTIWSSEEINPYQIYTFIDNDSKFIANNEKKKGTAIYDTYTLEELKFFPYDDYYMTSVSEINNSSFFAGKGINKIFLIDKKSLNIIDTIIYPNDFPDNGGLLYISASHDGSKIVTYNNYTIGEYKEEEIINIFMVYDVKTKQLISYTNYLDTREVFPRTFSFEKIIWNKDNIHYYCASQNDKNEFLKVNSLTGEIVKRIDDGSELLAYYLSDKNKYYIVITANFTYIYDMNDNIIQKHIISSKNYPLSNRVDYVYTHEEKDLIIYFAKRFDTSDYNDKSHRLFSLSSGEYITSFWEFYNMVTKKQSNFRLNISNTDNSLHVIYNYVDKPKTYLVRNFWDLPVINSVNETPDILKEFDNKIILNNSENKLNLIELYNISGQKILDIPIQNNEIIIDKTILPYGLYLLRYNYNNHSYTYKFIKE